MSGPAEPYRVIAREEQFRGRVFLVVSEEVVLPDGETVRREYLHHPGAVAVLAFDDRGRAMLVRQYRPAIGATIWELPAGVRDVDGELPEATGRRELAEETEYLAAQWEPFLEIHPSPGVSDEVVQVYLARQLSPVPVAERYVRRQEEANLTVHFVALAEAVAMVLRGEISNATATTAILAAHVRDRGGLAVREFPAGQIDARGHP
jgi:8-oxo-dGTP pyrophosphatase MutT (NUDIX family)